MIKLNLFLDFSYNFSPSDIQSVFSGTSAPQHILTKFRQKSDQHGGSVGFIKTLYELTPNNVEAVANWITNNYNK
jgi:hypothetical protein